MPFENRRSTVHPIEAATTTTITTTTTTSSSSSSSSSTTNQAKINRHRSIFAKLKRSSTDRPEPSFVIAHSDQPMSALFSPTRQVHSMDEDFFRHPVKGNGDGGGENDGNVDAGFDDDNNDSDFRPPAFLLEHLKREREARVAAQKRRHSVGASSQRLQAQRMMEKMEKIRAFDDLIQSGKTKTIKLSLTPELAV